MLVRKEWKECGGRKVVFLLNGALVRLEDVRGLPRAERLALMESSVGSFATSATTVSVSRR